MAAPRSRSVFLAAQDAALLHGLSLVTRFAAAGHGAWGSLRGSPVSCSCPAARKGSRSPWRRRTAPFVVLSGRAAASPGEEKGGGVPEVPEVPEGMWCSACAQRFGSREEQVRGVRAPRGAGGTCRVSGAGGCCGAPGPCRPTPLFPTDRALPPRLAPLQPEAAAPGAPGAADGGV